jgi:hypothetical protein
MSSVNKLLFVLSILLILIAGLEVLGQSSTVQPNVYKIALNK